MRSIATGAVALALLFGSAIGAHAAPASAAPAAVQVGNCNYIASVTMTPSPDVNGTAWTVLRSWVNPCANGTYDNPRPASTDSRTFRGPWAFVRAALFANGENVQ